MANIIYTALCMESEDRQEAQQHVGGQVNIGGQGQHAESWGKVQEWSNADKQTSPNAVLLIFRNKDLKQNHQWENIS